MAPRHPPRPSPKLGRKRRIKPWLILLPIAVFAWILYTFGFDSYIAPLLPKPFYRAQECLFLMDGARTADCGALYVYEDRAARRGVVKLPVVVFRADGPDRKPDPIVFLTGGPGGPAIGDMRWAGSAWDETFVDFPWVKDRDFILFDQRGTGAALPSLDCPEYRAATITLSNAQGLMDSVVACRDRLLSEGIDLTAYNTTESADDIEDLRRSLDLDRLNLVGGSYGSRLGLTILRRYPAGVRSAVFLALDPPESQLDLDMETFGGLPVLEAALRRCALDPDCRAPFSDIGAAFQSTVRALRANPLVIDIERPIEGRVEMRVDDVVFIILVLDGLRSAAFDRELARLIQEAGRGWKTRVRELLDEFDLNHQLPQFAWGMNLSVNCNDWASWSEADAEAADVPYDEDDYRFRYYQWASVFNPCSIWPQHEDRALDLSPVESDIPTLLLAGQLDQVTFPAWAEQAAKSLTNGHLFVLPDADHEVLESDCANVLAALFLDNPMVRPAHACFDAR